MTTIDKPNGGRVRHVDTYQQPWHRTAYAPIINAEFQQISRRERVLLRRMYRIVRYRDGRFIARAEVFIGCLCLHGA